MRVGWLHGFLGDPEVWAEVTRQLSADRTDVPLALPGHGGGPVQPTWRANLEVVAAALAGCDVVIGYSLGARVAAGLVAAGAVPRAVLISLNPGISDAERPARRASDATWAARLRTEGLAAFLDAWEAQPLFATAARAPAALRSARRARRLTHDPAQLARSLDVMGLAEMPDYRDEIDARCHVIAGADDPKYVALACALGAPHELIAGSGHDPTLEQPAALAAVIDRALGRVLGLGLSR